MDSLDEYVADDTFAEVTGEVELGKLGVNQEEGSRVLRVVSGAGHDALAMVEVAPIGMLFVRCRGGVSHDPDEHVASGDIGRAAAALAAYLVD